MLHVIFYIFKYLVVFPFVAFAWFVILTALLAFLAKDKPIGSILLVSMAVLSAIRITSYYNEDLSRDLAKMLPFALLGIFIVDVTYFSPFESVEALQEATTQWENIAYYLIFVIGLEFVLRITSPVLNLVVLPSKSR
jgi:FtsH-binding integral membrane protein